MNEATDRLAAQRSSLWEAIVIPSILNLTVALLFAAFAAAGAAVYTLTRDPTYQSQSTILLDHPDVANVPNVNPIIRLNALRTTYAALVSTEVIVDPVAERFGIDPGIVLANIDVGITTDSLVMYVIATAGGRAEAQALAREVTDELIDYVERDQAGDGVGITDRVTLVVVDNPRLGFQIAPTGTDAVAAAALAGAAGMAFGYAGLQLATAGRRMRSAAERT